MFIYIKSLRLNSIQVLVFLGLLGCLTPIEFPVEIAGGLLVVSGQISTISDQNYVSLGTTATTERLPIPLSGALIELVNDLDNSVSYTENPLQPGVYKLPGVKGITGTTYHIEIILPNGKIYKSIPEKMPEPTLLDSVYYDIVYEDIVDADGTFQNDQPFFNIYCNTTFSKTSTYFLRWKVEETFKLSPTDFPDPFGVIPPPCYIVQNADPQRIALFDGVTIDANKIQKQLVASKKIDWTFFERHYFTTYQSSISKESHNYLRKVNILANQVGSIFDTPPAEITGNIVNSNDPKEKVLGFFQATNQTYNRFFVLPENLPFKLLYEKCDYKGDFNGNTLVGYNPLNYPRRCIECTSVPNSSYERPVWF